MKTIYNNLLGTFTKKGKKAKARTILVKALNKTSDSLKIPVNEVYNKLAKELGGLVELKKIKIKKTVYKVPFPLNQNRRTFLFSKQLIDGVQKNKSRIKTYQKLSSEIMSYILEDESNLARKEALTKEILASRSNRHYRW